MSVTAMPEEEIRHSSYRPGVIGKFFKQFTEFFLPELHKDIDFTHKPKFLDNQLLKIVQKSGGKDRESDKLVEIKLKDMKNSLNCDSCDDNEEHEKENLTFLPPINYLILHSLSVNLSGKFFADHMDSFYSSKIICHKNFI